MNKFEVIVFIAISFLFTPSISKAMAQKPTNSPAWQILVKEKNCAINEPRNLVIKSQNEFDALWKESQNGIDFGPAKPKVDFSKQWAVACFLGMVKTGGHSLSIQSIKTESGAIIITLVHKRPGPGCVTAQVIEYPYLIAAVDPFVPDKAEFKIITQNIPCE
jgi:hypothetical protein